MDGTDKQEGWIRVVYSLSNSLKKKRKKTNQTFLVINVKSFLDEVCSQEKAAGYTSHPMEDTLLGWGSEALPSTGSSPALAHGCASSSPASSTSYTDPTHHIYRPQTTDSHITMLPAPKAQT